MQPTIGVARRQFKSERRHTFQFAGVAGFGTTPTRFPKGQWLAFARLLMLIPYDRFSPDENSGVWFGSLLSVCCQNMHVLLRHSGSRLFVARLKQWTACTDQARDFITINGAEQFAQAQQLSDLEVVLRYDAPVCELTLPLAIDASQILSHGP